MPRIFDTVKYHLAAFFLQEQAAGRLDKRAEPQQLAGFCIATIQGAMLMGKIEKE